MRRKRPATSTPKPIPLDWPSRSMPLPWVRTGRSSCLTTATPIRERARLYWRDYAASPRPSPRFFRRPDGEPFDRPDSRSTQIAAKCGSMMHGFCSFSGIFSCDVVVNQSLEGDSELIVGAFERNVLFPVDVHRAARRFASSGQADADVRGLGFPGPLTMHPITARVISSTPSYCVFQ